MKLWYKLPDNGDSAETGRAKYE